MQFIPFLLILIIMVPLFLVLTKKQKKMELTHSVGQLRTRSTKWLAGQGIAGAILAIGSDRITSIILPWLSQVTHGEFSFSDEPLIHNVIFFGGILMAGECAWKLVALYSHENRRDEAVAKDQNAVPSKHEIKEK